MKLQHRFPASSEVLPHLYLAGRHHTGMPVVLFFGIGLPLAAIAFIHANLKYQFSVYGPCSFYAVGENSTPIQTYRGGYPDFTKDMAMMADVFACDVYVQRFMKLCDCHLRSQCLPQFYQ